MQKKNKEMIETHIPRLYMMFRDEFFRVPF